jgi:RNA polymerase subunit RPABC4/transcription elongation factor Spt4
VAFVNFAPFFTWSALAPVKQDEPQYRCRTHAADRKVRKWLGMSELARPSQSQAAPRTPLEAPCSFGTTRVVTSSVKTCD